MWPFQNLIMQFELVIMSTIDNPLYTINFIIYY
jgi:hypothetical protein